MPLVVSGGFMTPSILAVILSCLGLAEQVGRVGRLAIGPGGLLVASRGALMLAPALGALVVAPLVVGHSREPSSVLCFGEGGPRATLGAAPPGRAEKRNPNGTPNGSDPAANPAPVAGCGQWARLGSNQPI